MPNRSNESERKVQGIFLWGVIVVLGTYIGFFGLPGMADKKQCTVSWGNTSVEQRVQESYLERVAQNLFGQKVAEAGQSEYAEAMELTRKGNKLQMNEQYEKGLPILEKALAEWEDVPDEEIEGEKAGNYAATLGALATCYVHTTLKAKIAKDDPYPNSIERLKKGKELAQEAIEHYTLAERTADSEDVAQTAYKYASGSFNILGLANKYLGNLERAEECYKEAIERRDNDDAEYNLQRLEDNYDVFLD